MIQTLLLMCFVSLFSCKHGSKNKFNSDVKIINGRQSAQSHLNEVVFLGLRNAPAFCTGSVIGHNAVLTAAHCVSRNISAGDITVIKNNVVEQKPLGSEESAAGTRNTLVTIAKKMEQMHEIPWAKQVHGLDLAVVHFPDQTFSQWFVLAKAPQKRGEVLIAGYGYDSLDLQQPTTYQKREGSTVIGSLSHTLYSFSAPSSEQSKLKYTVNEEDVVTGQVKKHSKLKSGPARGDSGGPMFFKETQSQQHFILGTCVGMREQISETVIRVIYTNLHSKDSLELMRKASSQGAVIEGLDNLQALNEMDSLPEE